MPEFAPALDRLRDAERVHSRRLRVTTAIAAIASLVPLLALPAPERSDDVSRARRWGFLGPERVVSEIEIPEHDGEPLELSVESGEASVSTAPATGVEGEAAENPRVPGGTPRPAVSAGDAISARALMRASLPTVRSEDLVIDVLVKPEYPREAQARGLEAIVELEALVDIDGTVRETQLLSNTGDPVFADAAASAVSRCRFRPYRQAGTPTPVFAHFRFKFRLI